MTEPDLRVQRTVDASPAVVWGVMGDPTAMSRFSPESVAQRWLPPSTGPQVGARFAGRNRNGIHRWSTRCTVVRYEPEQALAWDVVYQGLAVARWELALSPSGPSALTPGGTGTVVTQAFWDHRGMVMKVLGLIGRGVGDVLTHNRAGMERTLAAIAAAAERASA